MRGDISAEDRVTILSPIVRPLAPVWRLHFHSDIPADFSQVGDAGLIRFADAALDFVLNQPTAPAADTAAAGPALGPQQWGTAPWQGWASGP